jgi:hypothetical protein
MKKLLILPAVAALTLGVSACAKSEDAANSAALNDVTIDEDDALAGGNVDAATNLDASALPLNDSGVAGHSIGNGF